LTLVLGQNWQEFQTVVGVPPICSIKHVARPLLMRYCMSIQTSNSEFLAGDLTGAIIRAFFETYNDLGSGFPEHVARRALTVVMREAGLLVEEEVALPVWFHGTRIAMFRADLVVSERVIVEVKAGRELEKYHAAQVAHYLKATDLEVGLLLNFGSRPQFQRVIFQNDRKRRHFEAPSEIRP